MGHRKLGPVAAGIAGIAGIAGVAGTSGLSIMAARLMTAESSTSACLLATIFVTATSLVAGLGLILNYRLGKLALQAQETVAQRSASLQMSRLKIQQSVLDKIPDGVKAAQAYQKMAEADAYCLQVSKTAPVTYELQTPD
jgi:hypothetical protein